MRGLPALLLWLGCVLALAGCGLGAGSTPGAVRLTVTRDFGDRVLHDTPHPRISGQDTVMSLLLRNYKVDSRSKHRCASEMPGGRYYAGRW